MRPVPPRPAVRRRLAVALAVATVLLASACGGSDDEASDSPAPTGDTGAFPVTVDTVFGEVTIEEPPQRVVAVGWSDAETALALGVQPVAASDWLAFGGEGVGPWAEGRYDTPPEILGTLELDYEQIVALEPDLILNTRSSADPGIHDQLSAIAPTVGVPAGVETLYGTTWQQQMEIVSTALGLADEGQVLVDETQAEIDAAAEANPEFAGTTAAVGAFFGGSYGGYVDGDARVDLMTSLGFSTAPELQALAEDSFFVDVSAENLSLLSADLTVMVPLTEEDAATLAADPVLQAIPSAQAGDLVVLDDLTLISAFSSGSTLGTSAAVEGIVPILAETLAS